MAMSLMLAGAANADGVVSETQCVSIPKGFDIQSISFEAKALYGDQRIKIEIGSLRLLPCTWFKNRGNGKTMAIGDKASVSAIKVFIADESGNYIPKGHVNRPISFTYFRDDNFTAGKGLNDPDLRIDFAWDYESSDNSDWRFVELGHFDGQLGVHSWSDVLSRAVRSSWIENYPDFYRDPRVGAITVKCGDS
jgi:hypothetical protein